MSSQHIPIAIPVDDIITPHTLTSTTVWRIERRITIVQSFLKHSRCMTRCNCPAKDDALKAMEWLEDFFKIQ